MIYFTYQHRCTPCVRHCNTVPIQNTPLYTIQHTSNSTAWPSTPSKLVKEDLPSHGGGRALMGRPCLSRRCSSLSWSRSALSGSGSTSSVGARPPAFSTFEPSNRYSSTYAVSFVRRGRPSAAVAVPEVTEASSSRHQLPASACESPPSDSRLPAEREVISGVQ